MPPALVDLNTLPGIKTDIRHEHGTMLKSQKLDAAKIRQLIAAGKPGRYADGDRLYLQISRTGSVAWVFRYEHGGRERAKGLGPWPRVKLAAARRAARKERGKLAHDKDPLDGRAGLTFASAWAQY